MKAPGRVETARLLLSPPEPGDAAAIFQRYASDPEVTRFLGWPRHRSIDETHAFVSFSADHWNRWPAGPYLIWSRATGQLLGGTGFTFESPDHVVTGYVLAKDAWGQGFATEALTAVVRIARDIRVARLTAFCHPDHRASQRVLEKCGFVRDSAWSQTIEFQNLAAGVQQDVIRYELDPNIPGPIVRSR
ncbi:MAG TPA: GNAT family N-acetyltransferase [Vicinamibacterales bacterium]